VAPRIAVPTPTQSVRQTASAVRITAKAFTGSTTEAAAKVIASKAITSATATMTAAVGKCTSGKPEISENKDDRKNDYGFSQH
jgi:hypothetical protein